MCRGAGPRRAGAEGRWRGPRRGGAGAATDEVEWNGSTQRQGGGGRGPVLPPAPAWLRPQRRCDCEPATE